jgi:serine/threonine protein phosphatase PrpC
MQVSSALRAAGHTDPGRLRANNEDRFHYDPSRGLFIVVDGVGGQAAGEKAAETALATLRARLERETGAIEDRVREAITLANNEVLRLASLRPEWQGMACVLTVAAVVNGDVVVGHVGDTRLYKLRGSRIDKLTRDHSPVGEREDAGELTERDAMQHPRRNEVYRDVGSELHEPDDPDFIDVFRTPFEDDAALLVCTDGLTDQVPSTVIRDVVHAHAGDPRAIVRTLVDAANDAGGKDNVTVVYVENPRFGELEDTRDLRLRDGLSHEEAHSGIAVTSVAAGSAVRRWRIAALVVALLTVAAIAAYSQRERLLRLARTPAGPAADARVTINPGESIAAAVARATPGTEIVVEPGEYRERLLMKPGVRVVSRLPRAAALRLPQDAAETDAAVVAADVTGASLAGFRIVGDAATPLGIGVIVRNADLLLLDVEITGAQTAAVQFERGSNGALLASSLHDNPGTAIIVRSGATPRIAHSVFGHNASSERASATLLVEAGAAPVVEANIFRGLSPDSITLPEPLDGARFRRDNSFIDSGERRPPASPAGRSPTRGRR